MRLPGSDLDVAPPWFRALGGVGVALLLVILVAFFLTERPAPRTHPSRLGSPSLWDTVWSERPRR
jgi:hypothetical protein